MLIEARIIKYKDKWRVVSEKGKNLGEYTNRKDAEDRLKTVEMFKHMKASTEKTYTRFHFSPRFNDYIFDYYFPDPDASKEGHYVTEIGGVKVGFGSKYMLNRIVDKILPKIYPSGEIPASQVISRPIPKVSEPVVRRLGTGIINKKSYFSLFEDILSKSCPFDISDILKPYELIRKASKAVVDTVDFHGVTLDIEFPIGNAIGLSGEPIEAAYGFIRGTEGADGDEIDIYLGPNKDSDLVVKIENVGKNSHKYLEDKWMLGFNTKQEVVSAFIKHKGYESLGEVIITDASKFSAMFAKDSESPKHFGPSAKHGYGGRLIVLEGNDGSGKSSQCEYLKQLAIDNGMDVIVTPWISSAYISSNIKKLKANKQYTPLIGMLLCAADLFHRLDTIIIPSLKKGKLVIADRYYYTSIARDSMRNGNIDLLHKIYENILPPDMVIYCKASPDISVSRILKRNKGKLSQSEDVVGDDVVKYYEGGLDMKLHPDPKENFKMFLTGVSNVYDTLAKEHGFHTIDCDRSIDEVSNDINSIFGELLKERNDSTGEPGVDGKDESLTSWASFFDYNSTNKEGRHRLIQPEKLKDYFRSPSKTKGVSFIKGYDKEGKLRTQSIRFDKSMFSEGKAKEWLKNNDYSLSKQVISNMIHQGEYVCELYGKDEDKEDDKKNIKLPINFRNPEGLKDMTQQEMFDQGINNTKPQTP